MLKKLTFLLTFMLAWQSGFAQTVIPISQARMQPTGTVVTVRGIVTNGTELGTGLRYIQDGTAGIAAFSSSQLGAINRGDSIQITGPLKDYNNLLEIDPVTSVTLLGTNKALPTPIVFNGTITPAFAEQYEGRLVRLNNVNSITTTTGAAVSAFNGNTNYNLNGSASSQLRVSNASTGATGLVGKPAPTGSFDVIGIIGQFATGGPNTTSGYQILPRLAADIIPAAGPNIISAITPTSITTTGFTINFNTQAAGNTVVHYGTTPALGQTITNNAPVTAHSVALTGLQPATIYYVQVTSTNASGTSTSAIVPMVTASNSSGAMKVYFNAPVDHSYATPGNQAVYLNHTIDDTLIAYINRAQTSIDAAIYHWNMANISNIGAALNAAHARGVRVRILMDALANSTITNDGHTVFNPAIKITTRSTTQGIMHNKFLVFDAEATNPNKPLVWTGSTNWTGTQMNEDPNSVVIVQDQSLARAFVLEFQEMWNSTTATPGTPVWGSAKTSNTPQQFMINGKQVELYFSPSDNVNNRLIETINTANHDLFFASMIITRTDVAAAINARFQQPGMSQCMTGLINDTSFTGGYAYLPMKNVMGNRLHLWGKPTIMHHKHVIVDAGAPASDPLVWISTHNWTGAANTNNDENTLIIHDANIANQYYQEFAARMNEVVSTLPLCNFAASVGITPENKTTFTVYPNPAKNYFTVALPAEEKGGTSLHLFDMQGRLMLQKNTESGTETRISTNGLAKGMYYLQLSGAGFRSVQKLVIE